jgi:hypothetical protein
VFILISLIIGLAVPPSRPKLKHKSRSTTSITKSSVISSYQSTGEISNTAPKNKKPTTITIVTPNFMDWDQPNRNCQEKDDTSSVSSASTSTVNSDSAAVEALVIASLIPTRQVNREFDDMPAIILSGRKTDTEPVMTESIAEMVRYIQTYEKKVIYN